MVTSSPSNPGVQKIPDYQGPGYRSPGPSSRMATSGEHRHSRSLSRTAFQPPFASVVAPAWPAPNARHVSPGEGYSPALIPRRASLRTTVALSLTFNQMDEEAIRFLHEHRRKCAVVPAPSNSVDVISTLNRQLQGSAQGRVIPFLKGSLHIIGVWGDPFGSSPHLVSPNNFSRNECTHRSGLNWAG